MLSVLRRFSFGLQALDAVKPTSKGFQVQVESLAIQVVWVCTCGSEATAE